jgi:WD40 repeat protein
LLDKEGLFGTGEARARLVLLIDTSDRDNEWLLKYAKKVNPPAVFEAFRDQFAEPTIGRFSELGSKRVYASKRLALTPDRRFLAVAADSVFVFDMQERKQLWHCPAGKTRGGADDVAISADGQTVAAVDANRELTIWHKGPKRPIHVELPARPWAAAIAPDATWIAVGCQDCMIHLYDGEGRSLGSIGPHASYVYSLDLSSDGSRLASAGLDIRVWNTEDWQVLWENSSFADPAARTVSFSPRANHLVTTSYGRGADFGGQAITLWQVGGEKIRDYQMTGYQFGRACLSPNARYIACAAMAINDRRDECMLLDAETGLLLDRLVFRVDWFNDLVFYSNTEMLVAAQGHTRRPVVIWHLANPIDPFGPK